MAGEEEEGKSSLLFTDWFKPHSTAQVSLHHAKWKELDDFLKGHSKKFLILCGPTGCGKNSYIEAWAEEKGMELKKVNYYWEMSIPDSKMSRHENDLSQVVHLLNTAGKSIVTSVKSNCFRKFASLSISSPKTKQKKKAQVIVMNGLPECLKTWSPR